MLKKYGLNILRVVISLVLCIGFGTMLRVYTLPMEDTSLDLSLKSKDENPDPASFDSKGWRVYTQVEDTVTELTPDGLGGYTGLAPGQTFYFSRELTEDLDNPTLQIGVENANDSFSVFLDGELLYSDCSDTDNRIGYLTLPMSQVLREEPVKLSLPRNYQGKTLTVAQSTAEHSEADAIRACPADVILCCGYAYESDLIAESFSVAIRAVVLFATGIVLLLAFIRSHKIGFLTMAVVVLLWMCAIVSGTSFRAHYFGIPTFDSIGVCLAHSATVLLLFLAGKSTKFRPFLWVICGICWLSVMIYTGIALRIPIHPASPLIQFLQGPLMEWLITVSMILFLVLGITLFRKENRFYRLFSPIAIAAMVIFGFFVFITGDVTADMLIDSLSKGRITYIYSHLLPVFIFSAMLSALVEAIRGELEQRMERRLVQKQTEHALISYENMRRQHEEVMMLRHDMKKHFQTLRLLSSEENVQTYLDELIEQDKKIRPVVRSGNKLLDIILDSKLSAAIDSGIKVEIIRSFAPEFLPVSDADLCSLMMNILDNAITAAKSVETDHGFIRLDIRAKGRLLSIVCENSTTAADTPAASKSEPLERHGLGLKIIRTITERYNGTMETDRKPDHFRIRIVLPL